ncbi:LamG domain-containing protein [Ferruginibacter sp. HRS2-29]|uniref:LamG domain-containing protein n=1 Tax=Ferruginibacter sp. HRS2-29 TaxID=2487334 RepID=UPI0020CD4058|nr:LamG domain-containing protein [Ferruginibacter sp. HRS2-29]MCP9749719.1 LamG domain-containing protein [Ferruginibacter sp. HRS2-29]
MKKISFKMILGSLTLGLALASCYDKFDPKTYAPPFTISGYSSVSQIQPANLVGYWSFDGSLVDSVSGTSGVNTGTSFTPGFKGQAMQGGINKYVQFTPGAAIKALTSMTLSYWVKNPPPSVGIVGTVSLSHNGNFWGDIDVFYENGSTATAGKLRAFIYNGTGDRTISKDGINGLFDAWTNITISYDGATSTAKVYKDGNLIHTQTFAGYGNLNFTNSGNLVFGCTHFMTTPSLTNHGPEPWASFLTGQLDEVRLYKSVLTDQEVNAMVILQGKGK